MKISEKQIMKLIGMIESMLPTHQFNELNSYRHIDELLTEIYSQQSEELKEINYEN